MSTITQTIKNHILTITGKRRLTILQKFIDTTYSKPEQALRNVVGEYSPKQIITDLRQISTFIKSLCANNGRNFKKYYSYTQLDTIQSIVAQLSEIFEPIQTSTGQNTLRTILYAIPQHLESLKQSIGPHFDIKATEIISELKSQIAEYTEQHTDFEELREELKKDAKEIQSNLTKSRKLKDEADVLMKELASTQKEFTNHETMAKEIVKRIQTISSSTNTIQTKLEKSIKELQSKEVQTQELSDTIKTNADESSYLAGTTRTIAQEIESIRSELQYLTAQARHALHINHGAGVAKSYQKLAEQSKKPLPQVILVCSSLVFFTIATLLTIQSYFSIRELSSIGSIVTQPLLLGKIILIPLLLIAFFSCIGTIRTRIKNAASFSNKVAALESFLHVSDRFPYNSPEKLNTANYIFSIIRKDFGLEHEMGGYVQSK